MLVNADLSGQSSHGVARIPIYLDKLEKGFLKPNVKKKLLNKQLILLHWTEIGASANYLQMMN